MASETSAVEGDVVEETRGEVLRELVHALPRGAVDVHQVGARTGRDAEAEGRGQVVARHAALVGDAELGEADVGEADRPAVDGGDDEVVEVLDRLEEAEVAHRELGQRTLDEAARQLEVLAVQGHDDVVHRQAVGGELVAVDPDPDHGLAEAGHEDVADPRHRLQLGLHHLVGVVRELAGIEPGERHPQHGLGVDVELLDDGRLGVERQLADRARDLVANVLGGDVDVAVGGEHDRHLRHALAGVGGDLVDALDRVDRGFDDVGDVGLHDLRRGAGQEGDHRDHREVDGRQEVDGQGLVAEDAEDHQRQHQHHGEDRTADRDVVDVHARSTRIHFNSRSRAHGARDRELKQGRCSWCSLDHGDRDAAAEA